MNPKLKETGARLIDLGFKHPFIPLAIGASLVCVLVIFGPALLLGIRESFSNRTIKNTKTATATEITGAEQEKISAGKIEIERKAEDLHREEELKPQRQRAATSFAEARQRRKEAEDRYEKARNARRSPDPDDLTLRRRNCTDLAELYPGQRFAGCQ